MRLALLSRTLLLLAMPAVVVTCVDAQDHPNVQPSKIANQLSQAPAASQPASAPAATSAPKPAQEPKAPGKAAAAPSVKPKTAAKTAAEKTPAAADKKSAKPPVEKEKPAEEKVSSARRDPFDPLLNKHTQGSDAPQNLPPGKAGLVVGTLHIDGIVGGARGMIAIVSNPQQRVYFLREGDKLYDGSVQHITLEAVSFQEVGKDAFGKPLERQVTKRLYPSPGEQQ